MLCKVVAIQARLGQELTLEEKIFIFKERPDFVCLPEYYLVDNGTTGHPRAAMAKAAHLDYLSHLSDELSTCLIAGTVIEAIDDHLFNSCYVINRGFAIGRYCKRYPLEGELKGGLSPGGHNLILDVNGVRIGIMICSDVFQTHLFDEYGAAGVDLLFVPTASPYRPDDTARTKKTRDRKYFLNGALSSGAYVIKVCGVGELFGRQLQGRSLFAAPWDIIRRVDYAGEGQKRLMAITLDIHELREFRRKMTSRGQSQAQPRPLSVKPPA